MFRYKLGMRVACIIESVQIQSTNVARHKNRTSVWDGLDIMDYGRKSTESLLAAYSGGH